MAEDQTKLSTQFGLLADLVREAHFWAQQEAAPFVTAAHVRKAIEEKVSRVNLMQEHMQEMITRGTLFMWAVKTIDAGMEMLTGIPAGGRDTAGRFPAGTLNERVDRRLREFAECLKAFQAVGATACR